LPAGETEALDFALQTPRDSDAGKTLASLAKTETVNWDLVFGNLNKDVDKILEIVRSRSWPDAISSHDSYSKRRHALAKRMMTSKAIRDHLGASSVKPDALAEIISSTLSDYVMMSHFAAIQADARGRQAAQLSRIALALRTYAVEKGSYPDSLSTLVPDYLSALPKDFFTGGVSRYLKSNKGFLLYSVGPDRQDTQGRNRSDPPSYRGDDLRIRAPLQSGSISP